MLNAKDENVQIAMVSKVIESRYLEQEPRVIDHIKKDCAHALADFFLTEDFLQFEQRKAEGLYEDQTMVVAKLAVVTPDRIMSIEQRVKEATGPAVSKVVQKAIEKINVWGSHYGRNAITKEEAIRFILEAERESR